MLIREFVPEDIKRVLQIENASFDQSYGFDMHMKLYKMGIGFLVAVEDDHVVGYIMFWIKNEGEGHIIAIAVDEDYQRRKIGTQLLSNAIILLNKCNSKYITLEVNGNNKGAIEFYKNFNFKVDRMVPNYYENKDPAIVMNLEFD